MRNVHSRRAAVASFAALALSARGLPAPRRAVAAEPIRLGILNFDTSTPACYAASSGLFADAGLDVSLQVFNSGAAVTAGVIGGSLDMGLSSLFGLLSAHAHGLPLKLVAAAANFDLAYPTVTGLLVKADAPFQRYTDPGIKIISVPALQDLMVVNTRSWIDRGGGHSDKIQFVELSGPGVAPALDSGRIDAAGINNPFLSDLLATGKFRTLGNPSQGIAPHYLTTGWIAATGYAEKNAATVKTFVNVLTKASAYANAHSSETAPSLAKYTGYDPAVIARMPRSHYVATLDVRDIQPLIDASVKYGIIPAAFPARDLML